ncbi:MAG: flagellar biosynthetic protein FlhB [Rhodocyclales bacterium]|jgi:flagellar biosynthetic protein FlhB|nr:MAG: flagellar biosynthetic protein FlhB [Rhodocyclales bacterium]
MAEDSDLEKTEPASPRRLEQAREEGQVPQSRELSAFLVLIAGSGALWAGGSWLAQRISGAVSRGLTFGRDEAFDTTALPALFLHEAGEALATLGPLLLILVVAALAGPFTMGGLNFSSKALAPDWTRLDPLKGFGRMFSMHSVGELVKGILKALLVGGVVVWVVLHEKDQVFALIGQPVEAGLHAMGQTILFSTLVIVASMTLIVALDVPFQLWQYHSKLRMTKEEVRKEMKEMEGDPQLKARIRSQQREIARRRMMAAVPKAQVVVTNPTHFAVALAYDERMPAPRVVAKGRGAIAQRIREIAQEHGVPLLEAPPLARALYAHTDLDQTIPPALFRAVAEVMAYVYQLNAWLARGGRPPQLPADLPVPAELDPGVAE